MTTTKTGGHPTDRSAGSRKLVWLAWLLALPAAIGLTVLIALGYGWYDAASVVERLANQILANAGAPTDRELPPTSHPFPYASHDIQVLGGQGDELGCSIAPFVENRVFPPRGDLSSISLRMRQACIFHDYCYRHGAATYGYGQADCDYLLLEQAFRICRFVNKDESVGNCVSDARKVLLGVRWGGHDFFKRADGIGTDPAHADRPECAARDGLIDDRCTSSYFEFDPYPIRSKSFTAYRIADAPAGWRAEGAPTKALYVFEIRPSGTRVTIVGWNRALAIDHCAGYTLPGSFDVLNVAPQILASKEDGGTFDRFVWWRRYDLDRTGGHLVHLAPGRAALKDWENVFPGTQEFPPEGCPVTSPAGVLGAHPAAATVLIADARVRLPTDTSQVDDLNFSELHPAPGLEPPRGFRLMALRTHTCLTDTNTLCYHDLVIEPGVSPERPPEPYAVRDEVNRPDRTGPVGSDPDRYRNFMTPPMPIAGAGAEVPVLAWLRRGEKKGETFRETALLRRSQHVGTTGASAGLVRLADFPEAAEPLIVLERTSLTPRLASLAADASHRLQLSYWRLPPPHDADSPVQETRCANDTVALGPLTRSARFVVCRERVPTDGCLANFDDGWVVRPPVVDATSSAPRMFLSRLWPAPANGTQGATLEIASLALPAQGPCEDLGRQRFELPRQAPPTGVRGEPPSEESLRNAIAEARARPILVSPLGDGTTAVVVPNARRPSISFAARLR